jgi:hypothetical protein
MLDYLKDTYVLVVLGIIALCIVHGAVKKLTAIGR